MINYPIDTKVTLRFKSALLLSENLVSGAAIEWLDSGLVGSAKLIEVEDDGTDGDDVADSEVTDWTFATGSKGVWTVTIPELALTENEPYILEVVFTAPVAHKRRVEVVASYIGAACA